jgi:hypothetical protein
VTLGTLSAVVEDLSVLLDLGLRVDAVAARRDAENAIERWWIDQPTQLLERLTVQDERLSGDLHRLLERRQREDEIGDRLAGAPPEVWFEEWYRLQRRFGGKGSSRWLLSTPLLWSPLADSRLGEIAPDLYAQLVADEVRLRLPTVPTVERVSYENPLEVILVGVAGVLTGVGFKFGTFTEFLKIIRDWPAERREGQARAREAEATASQAEVRVQREAAEVDRVRAETRELNARASKAELEAEILRRYALQGNRLDDLVEVGLVPRELQAMTQLTAGDIALELDEDED